MPNPKRSRGGRLRECRRICSCGTTRIARSLWRDRGFLKRVYPVYMPSLVQAGVCNHRCFGQRDRSLSRRLNRIAQERFLNPPARPSAAGATCAAAHTIAAFERQNLHWNVLPCPAGRWWSPQRIFPNRSITTSGAEPSPLFCAPRRVQLRLPVFCS